MLFSKLCDMFLKLKAILLASVLAIPALAQEELPIVPQPRNVEFLNGNFAIDFNTEIVNADGLFKNASQYLQWELQKRFRINLANRNAGSGENCIKFTRTRDKDMPGEGYELVVRPGEIIIAANSEKGAFYGCISLLQMVAAAQQDGGKMLLPACLVTDEPLYGWRGFMLDESRHFFGKDAVKDILDWMAYYKLNKFHWHLTDEPAWRLMIQGYPFLAYVGGVGSWSNPYLPAQFYTQDDVREIIEYAAARQIEVIPEIDMPGHATAANKAYPEFSGGGSKDHPEFTFNPGNEGTYSYLSRILRETNTLFPAAKIHLGGDEVSFGNGKWATDPGIQQLMKSGKLKDLKAVEQYFMERMADSVMAMGSQVLAWDEMADVDLPRDSTIIYWWRHDQPKQLKKALDNGYRTVICPRLPFYFDFVQDSTHKVGRKWGKQYVPLERVYGFDAATLVPSSQQQLILGIQANLWTERVENVQRLQFMLFPRICALSEACWSLPASRDFPSFQQRMKYQYKLFDQAHIYYYKPGREEKP